MRDERGWEEAREGTKVQTEEGEAGDPRADP